MGSDPDVATAAFAFEMGVLKRLRRAGWWHAGVRDPESVAEHSLRVAQLASIIAAQEGADSAQASHLAIWHDSQETRTGDIPHTGKPYLAALDHETITKDQVSALPKAAREAIENAVSEYEAHASPAAVCARDADKLECLLQALEYRAAGYTSVEEWITSSRDALKTPTAQRIADAALQTSILAWRAG